MLNDNIGQKFNTNDRENRKDGSFAPTSSNGIWSNYGFSRDLSRIIFSKSYRRMAGKTQIYPPHINEHLMTRLTHTLMVNNIAMDISYRINAIDNNRFNINLDLVQAIANGHDIGHTPFGHAGERELNIISQTYFSKEYFFKHNIFSVNVLQNLDRVKGVEYGYDLSWQVIDGILKHTDLGNSLNNENVLDLQLKNKFFSSNILKNALMKIDKTTNSYYEYPFPLTVEGQIVKMADEIAQFYHDVQDIWSMEEENDIVSFLKKILDVSFELKEDYTKKFNKTFMTDGRINISKLTDSKNREYFCNELKEVFINDVVMSFKTKCDITDMKVLLPDGRFIVRNFFFYCNKNKKAIPKYNSDYVEHIAIIFQEYRKKMLTNRRAIVQYDRIGSKCIRKAFQKLLKNKDLLSLGDEIINKTQCLPVNKGEVIISQRQVIITFDNYNEMRDIYIELLYKKFIQNKKNIQVNDKLYYILADLVKGVVIESIAKMTDYYVKSKVLKKND